jgi:small subunit ribosomal protein S2
VFWLLARQILRDRGEIAPDGELTVSIDDFETKLEEETAPAEAAPEEE